MRECDQNQGKYIANNRSMVCRPFERSASSDASVESSEREPPDAGDTDLRSDQLFDIAPKDPNPTNHPREDIQSGRTFTQFPKLSPELRLMIWKHTWPASRVIEVAICEDETAEEYTDVAILRCAGSLVSLLEGDFGSRIVEEEPLEKCPPPVALQVCRESRSHTLSQYRIMKHTRSRHGSFYFNPHCDMLWLSLDSTDEPEHLRDLQRCYGEQLNAIETLLVEEAEWNVSTPAGYTSNYLEPFNGLRSIQVLFSDTDEDIDEDIGEDTDEETDEDAGGEDNGGESSGAHSQDSDENGNQEPGIEARELLARADELRAEYTEFLKVHKETAKTIRCMDRSGTFY